MAVMWDGCELHGPSLQFQGLGGQRLSMWVNGARNSSSRAGINYRSRKSDIYFHFYIIIVLKRTMAANAMVAGPSVLLPSKAVCRVQQRSAAQRPAFGSNFVTGSGRQFAGQSLQVETTRMAGSRKVTAMAAKSEIDNLFQSEI